MITYAATIVSFIALVYYSVLLMIVVRQNLRSLVRRFFSLYLLSMIVWSFSAFMIFSDLGVASTVFWNRVLIVGSMGMPISFFGFTQAFLNQDRRRILWAGVVGYIIIQAMNAAGQVVVNAHVENGFLYNQYGPIGLTITSASWVFFLGFSAYDLISAYRRSKDAIYRNRLRYLFLVLLAIFSGTLTNLVPGLRNLPGDVMANIVSALLITYAILRYQLLDFTFVVRKGLLYTISTLIIGASYYLVISLALLVFNSISGPQVFIISLAVAILTALVVQPLRDKTQFFIDRLFFREKYDAGRMLQRVSQTAALVLDLDQLTHMILEEVTSTLHIERGAFFIRDRENSSFSLHAFKGSGTIPNLRLGPDHPLVSVLKRTDETLRRQDFTVMPAFRGLWENERVILDQLGIDLIIPLKIKGELFGIFCVGPKMSDNAYTEDDRLTLTTLANQTAVAIETARLYSAEQSRREELDALYNLSRQLVISDDVSSVLDSTIRHVVQSAHVTFARIVVADESGVFRCLSAFPVREIGDLLGVGRIEPPMTWRFYQEVIDQNRIAVLSSGGSNLSDDEKQGLMLDGVASLCLCPLRMAGKGNGVIALGEARQESREPFDSDKLRLIGAIADQTASALLRADMHEQMENSFIETVLALANAMDARDTYTNNHSQSMAFWAEAICRELNFSEEQTQAIRWASLLHDIGKIGVPDEILRKRGPLTEKEWLVMRRHPEDGARIVAPVRKLSNVAPLIRAHQEHYDGSGYPDGLRGEQIPLGARLLSIVDAYGAMTDDRPYRAKRKRFEAIEELRRCKGIHFDPVLVDVFIQILERDATRPLGPLPDSRNEADYMNG